MAWKRYKDPGSGDEFTVDEKTGKSMGLTPIGKDAVDGNGRPLPPKKNINKGAAPKPASDKKDG